VIDEVLPTFRYYADPFGEGRFERSATACEVCGRGRGWAFVGVLYSAKVDDPVICPWCIADGTAAEKWNGSFNETAEAIAEERDQEIRECTPNMETWQDLQWPCHCNDACCYLGQPDAAELRAKPNALEALLARLAEDGHTGDGAERIVDAMGYSPTTYLFRCLHCGRQIVEWDSD